VKNEWHHRKVNLLKSQLNGNGQETVENTSEAPQSYAVKDEDSSRLHVKMPLSAIAGLHGTDAEKFQEYQLENERLIPVNHCWTPTGDILVGCLDGELLRVRSSLE
jgi:hypothetical protein